MSDADSRRRGPRGGGTSKAWTDWALYHGDHYHTGASPSSYVDEVRKTISFNRTGNNIVNWRTLVANEQNAASAMNVTYAHYPVRNALQGYLSYLAFPYTQAPEVYWHNGFIGSVNIPDDASPATSGLIDAERARVQSLISKKVFNRLRELDHQFQGGVFFGEIKPTFEMLVHPFKTLRGGILNYFTALRRRRRGVRGSPSLKKILSDTWLEYSFGWQPLLSDIKDAAVALARIYNNIPRSKLNVEVTGAVDLPQVLSPVVTDLISYNVVNTVNWTYKLRVYGLLKHLQEPTAGLGFLERCAQLSGFDFRSFVPTAWELVPWSFFVDYFSNVGDILYAYSTDTSHIRWLNKVEISWTTRTKSSTVDTWSTMNRLGAFTNFHPTKVVVTGTGGSVSSEYMTMTRWVDPPLPYPGLEFNLGINPNQFANIGALLLGGRVPRPYY